MRQPSPIIAAQAARAVAAAGATSPLASPAVMAGRLLRTGPMPLVLGDWGVGMMSTSSPTSLHALRSAANGATVRVAEAVAKLERLHFGVRQPGTLAERVAALKERLAPALKAAATTQAGARPPMGPRHVNAAAPSPLSSRPPSLPVTGESTRPQAPVGPATILVNVPANVPVNVPAELAAPSTPAAASLDANSTAFSRLSETPATLPSSVTLRPEELAAAASAARPGVIPARDGLDALEALLEKRRAARLAVIEKHRKMSAPFDRSVRRHPPALLLHLADGAIDTGRFRIEGAASAVTITDKISNKSVRARENRRLDERGQARSEALTLKLKDGTQIVLTPSIVEIDGKTCWDRLCVRRGEENVEVVGLGAGMIGAMLLASRASPFARRPSLFNHQP